MMEKSIIRDIQNFTETGYRSPMYDFWVSRVQLDVGVARNEIEEYTSVFNLNVTEN